MSPKGAPADLVIDKRVIIMPTGGTSYGSMDTAIRNAVLYGGSRLFLMGPTQSSLDWVCNLFRGTICFVREWGCVWLNCKKCNKNEIRFALVFSDSREGLRYTNPITPTAVNISKSLPPLISELDRTYRYNDVPVNNRLYVSQGRSSSISDAFGHVFFSYRHGNVWRNVDHMHEFETVV